MPTETSLAGQEAVKGEDMWKLAFKSSLIACLGIVLYLPLSHAEDISQAVAIRGRWVWDGSGRPAIPKGVILVRDGRIIAVGKKEELAIPPDATWLDESELFLMPGLVNSHEHFSLDQFAGADEPGLMDFPASYLALRAAHNGRTSLRSGVTTARVPGDKDFLDIQYKRAFDEDMLPGPRLVVAARFLRPPDGFPNFSGLGPAPSGEDELRRTIREDIRAGADFCKMFISGTGVPVRGEYTVVDAIYFTKKEIETIVDECHGHGKKVTAHVIKGGPSFDTAVEMGVDSFEHGVLLTREEIQKVKDHNIVLVVGMSQWFLPEGGYPGEPPPPNGEQILQKWYSTVLSVKPKLAVGVDGFHEAGAMAKEVALLVRYGFTNEEALLIATRNGGELSGLPVGTLEPGKYADIIGVQGNPSEDINSLQRVEFVMKGGKVYNLSEE